MAALEELDYEELWGEGASGRVGAVRVVGSLEACSFTEFGNEVWPGSKVLGEWLTRHSDVVAGKRVVEVGAGCGLPGLVAAAVGARRVTLTDLPEALASLRRNASENARAVSCEVTCEALRWGAHGAGLPDCDVVLGADVVYKEALIAPLLSTLRALVFRVGQTCVLARAGKG